MNCAPGAIHAVDGVFEISESCAISLGCFDGDSASFPVTITESGSYRLTSNLTTDSVNTTLIEVNANNVSIDLNGFSLLGPNAGAGTGDGINASGNVHTTIRNGSIQGMGSDGIVIGSTSYLEELVVVQNGGRGIAASGSIGSLFRRLVVWGNDNGGVVSAGGSFGLNHIMDSTVTINSGGGVVNGFCSHVLMALNSGGNSCTAIAPNRCDVASQCD